MQRAPGQKVRSSWQLRQWRDPGVRSVASRVGSANLPNNPEVRGCHVGLLEVVLSNDCENGLGGRPGYGFRPIRARGIFGVDCGFEIGMSGGPLLVRHPKGHAARGRRDLAVAGRGYADGVLDGEPQPGGARLGIPPGAGPRSQSGGAARRAGGKPALIERRRHCANRGLPDVAARSPARSRRAGRDGSSLSALFRERLRLPTGPEQSFRCSVGISY